MSELKPKQAAAPAQIASDGNAEPIRSIWVEWFASGVRRNQRRSAATRNQFTQQAVFEHDIRSVFSCGGNFDRSATIRSGESGSRLEVLL